jgi:hypothetical protein
MEVTRLLAHVGHAEYLWKLGSKFGCFFLVVFETQSRHFYQRIGKLVHVFLHFLLGHWSLGYLHGHREVGTFTFLRSLLTNSLMNIDDCIHFTLREWTRMSLAPTLAETERAKSQLKASLLLGLDGTTAIAEDVSSSAYTFQA